MPDFDVIVRNGTVVDGTRSPRYRADLGIRDGLIVQIDGLRNSTATRTLDATGCIVAPGFVDLHTHYDAQLFWDPYCSVSSWHGVTTVVIGNCGFGFAPCRPEDRERAMLMMTRNEQIPLESMRAGMPWDWVTFGDFLDSVERTPKGVNIASFFPLNPALIWVMGLEAAKSRRATEPERAELRSLLNDALDRGAIGWTVQRLGPNTPQPDFDGTPMPTDVMSDDDVLLFAEVLGERYEGSIQITQMKDLADPFADFGFQERLAEVSGRPLIYNNVLVGDDPKFHRRQLEWLDDCNQRGLAMIGQSISVRILSTFKMDTFNLFDIVPGWREMCTGTQEEKFIKFADPERRALVRSELAQIESPHAKREEGAEGVGGAMGGPMKNVIVSSCGTNPELQRYVGLTLGKIAETDNKHVVDVLLDLSLAGGLKVEFTSGAPILVGSDVASQAEVAHNAYTVPGQSDGGAHVKFFTGASFPTDFLTWMVRDTEQVSLEDAHYKLSYLPARAAGIRNRGHLAEGTAADIVIYDLEHLKRVPEWGYEVAYDFPDNEWRRVQRAAGYRWILVNGEITFQDGTCTQATSGKLLRHGRG